MRNPNIRVHRVLAVLRATTTEIRPQTLDYASLGCGHFFGRKPALKSLFLGKSAFLDSLARSRFLCMYIKLNAELLDLDR